MDNTSTAKDFFEWAHEAATKGLPPEDGLATDVAPGDGTMEQMGDLVDIGGAKYHLAMDNDFDDAIDEVAALDSDLNKILGNSRKNCPPEPLPTSEEEPEKSPCKDKIYGIDPSGYVYEAVPSNRLAGVEAKIYQQTSGAYSEWTDAKNYGGQSSTIETGPTGQYRWDRCPTRHLESRGLQRGVPNQQCVWPGSPPAPDGCEYRHEIHKLSHREKGAGLLRRGAGGVQPVHGH